MRGWCWNWEMTISNPSRILSKWNQPCSKSSSLHWGPILKNKQDTKYHKALSVGLKVAITLRYLVTGDTCKILMYGFRVPDNTICNFIPQVCEAIVEEFNHEVIAYPTTPDEWWRIAERFAVCWNFHNILGALDGKHVHITYPACGGSMYYNYKGFHSIIPAVQGNNNNNNNNILYWIYMLSLQLIFHMVHRLVIWLVSICS